MSKKMLGLILLLIGGEIIGLVAGNYAYRLFDQTVPPAVITTLVRNGARGAYLLFGGMLGIVIALWTVLVAWCARFFLGGSKTPARSAA
jgi:hypothetical protein